MFTDVSLSYPLHSLIDISGKFRFILADDKREKRYGISIKVDPFDKFYIPYFLCFGQHEINEYKKNNIKVKNFFKVGSLRTSNFLHLAQLKSDFYNVIYYYLEVF